MNCEMMKHVNKENLIEKSLQNKRNKFSIHFQFELKSAVPSLVVVIVLSPE